MVMSEPVSIADALAAAFDGDELPPWDGHTLVLDPSVRYIDARTWDEYAELGRLGIANVRMVLARPDYRAAWVEAFERARQLSPRDPDPVDAVLESTAVDDEAAAMFAVWAARVPQRYRRAGLDDFDPEMAERARAWCASTQHRPSLVVIGPTGVGKTRLAYGVTRHLFVDRVIASWDVISMPTLLTLLRPGGDEHAFEHYATIDLLVLDDVGAERPTEWSSEQIDALVDIRWRYGLPTVVTSNLSRDDFAQHVGDRVYSRLVHDGMTLRLTGDDRRKTHSDDDDNEPEYDPRKPCPNCRDVGFVDAPRSYVERTGHDAVYPCRTCRPETYRSWANGDYMPQRGLPERRTRPITPRQRRRRDSSPPPEHGDSDAPPEEPTPKQPVVDLPERRDIDG